METNVATQPISKEIVSAKVNVTLTKVQLGFQQLSDLISKLEFNEDNLPQIAEAAAIGRKMKKIIEDEHKAEKEPYLRQGQIIDESRRAMIGEVDNLINPVSEKYTKLCEDIAERTRKQQAEEQRKQLIQEGIASNMINFSTKIANCKTNAELLKVESLINLEKSYKNKYGEFLETAVEKYNSLTVLIKSQKENIKELEKLEAERLKAEKQGNDEKLLQLQEMQENLNNRIEEKKVEVQETAITSSAPTYTAQQIMPTVKARMSKWTWEVQDIKEVAKKYPAWIKMETEDDLIDAFLSANKEDWNSTGVEAKVINGIKFFIRKTY